MSKAKHTHTCSPEMPSVAVACLQRPAVIKRKLNIPPRSMREIYVYFLSCTMPTMKKKRKTRANVGEERDARDACICIYTRVCMYSTLKTREQDSVHDTDAQHGNERRTRRHDMDGTGRNARGAVIQSGIILARKPARIQMRKPARILVREKMHRLAGW